MSHTLVLGIGNTILSDEGIGVFAMNELYKRYGQSPGLEFIDGGTLSFTLAADIENAARLIVLDAAELHVEPGTIETFVNEGMDAFLGAPRRSVHEVGLIDLMDIARLTEHLPHPRALIGIQPLYMDWGDAPTPELQSAMPGIELAFTQLLDDWGIQYARDTGAAA